MSKKLSEKEILELYKENNPEEHNRLVRNVRQHKSMTMARISSEILFVVFCIAALILWMTGWSVDEKVLGWTSVFFWLVVVVHQFYIRDSNSVDFNTGFNLGCSLILFALVSVDPAFFGFHLITGILIYSMALRVRPYALAFCYLDSQGETQLHVVSLGKDQTDWAQAVPALRESDPYKSFYTLNRT
jgi:hypothetical protein